MEAVRSRGSLWAVSGTATFFAITGIVCLVLIEKGVPGIARINVVGRAVVIVVTSGSGVTALVSLIALREVMKGHRKGATYISAQEDRGFYTFEEGGFLIAEREAIYSELPPMGRHEELPQEPSDSIRGKLDRYRRDMPLYERNRYVMQDVKDRVLSPYINASKLPEGVILTQGPTEESVPDFWLMVWDSRAQIIVMATEIRERVRGKPKEKCAQYWPMHVGGICVLNDSRINITMTEELDPESVLTRRVFTLQRGREIRQVTQLHIRNWEDHKGISLDAVLPVVQEMDRFRCEESSYILHCSAGAGRSGVVAACYYLYQLYQLSQVEGGVTVDIPELVRWLRTYRYHCIMSESQYEMLFAFADSLQASHQPELLQ